MSGHPVPHVRFAVPGDSAEIARVHIAAWRAAYQGIMNPALLDGLNQERVASRWHREITAGYADAVLLVAVDDTDAIVGIGSCGEPRDEAPPGVGELWMLNCHPDVWGRGIGSRLLGELERQLSDHGKRVAYLWVAEGNERARHFYAREGWYDTGERRSDDRFEPPVSECRYEKELAPIS